MNRFLLAAGLLAAASACAEPIISVTGDPGGLSLGQAAMSSSWTQTASYSNVSVSAVLTNRSGIGQDLAIHAFLTDSIGTGTTVADEIESTALVLAPGFDQDIELFSGLTLGPGTYFLTIQLDGGSTTQGGWSVAIPTLLQDAGVTRGTDRFLGTAAAYAPATNMTALTAPQSLLFSVDTVANAVPEPSTPALLALALGALAWPRRWRLSHRLRASWAAALLACAAWPAAAGPLTVTAAERSIAVTVGGPQELSTSATSGTFDEQLLVSGQPNGIATSNSTIHADGASIDTEAGLFLRAGDGPGSASTFHHIDFTVGAEGLDYTLDATVERRARGDAGQSHLTLGIINLVTLVEEVMFDLFDDDIPNLGPLSAAGSLAAGQYRFVADLDTRRRDPFDTTEALQESISMQLEWLLHERQPPSGVPEPASLALVLAALALSAGAARRGPGRSRAPARWPAPGAARPGGRTAA